jgi:hypothetical protein
MMWLVYTDNDGKMHPYWCDVKRYEMMRNAYMQLDEQIFWGMANINPDSSFRTNEKGHKYYSGDGIYHQCNRRLRHQYNTLDLGIFDTQAESMYYDTAEGKPTLVYFGGIKFRNAFTQLIYKNFSQEPSVIYFDGTGNFRAGAGKGDNKLTGIRTVFNYYETSFAKIIISGSNYFDRRTQPTLYTQQGEREQSYRAVVLNISKNLRGESPISFMTLAGRQSVIASLPGMSKPGAGGIIATPVDMEAEHMLTECGVAVHNPNILGELRLAKARL